MQTMMQVIFNGGIAREYFAGTRIQTHDLLTHVFFITVAPSLQDLGLLQVI